MLTGVTTDVYSLSYGNVRYAESCLGCEGLVSKKLHCDICEKMMPQEDWTIRPNFSDKYCVWITVYGKSSTHLDVCQDCKRNVMRDVLAIRPPILV